MRTLDRMDSGQRRYVLCNTHKITNGGNYGTNFKIAASPVD